ncbi:MAG TPA: YihY/virulence factor BrkB family protein [Aggregatilinea sp.]|jgi:membrane protein|uniref:YihY/virulence factor BrkB family protein n=1 Tax=Aggregatilinea sp. TaxID=2806333 RepID=UPI002BF95A59|nr:YihY/virulence factor BrkB family protein [Aggregatilinea sp.]HML24090.1 YihY/virulence factor BrkB family protein [Aggregatilinea sp.]
MTSTADNVPARSTDQHALRFYERWWILANAMTDGLLYHLWRAIYRFSKQGLREAAALSYYAIFSLFPLILLLLIIIGTVFGPAAAHNQINDVLRLFLPASTSNFIQDNIAEALKQRSGFGIVAAITLTWSALGLFSGLSSALSRTFRDTNPRNTWQQRVFGMVIVVSLGALLLASLATSVIFGLLDLLMFYNSSSWLTMGALIVPLSLSVAIFGFLYRFVPRRRVRWDAIWVAAFVAGSTWEVAKRLFAWYLDNFASYNAVYGPVATLIITMLWIYLTAIIVLLGAEICVSLDDWMSKKSVQNLSFHADPSRELL